MPKSLGMHILHPYFFPYLYIVSKQNRIMVTHIKELARPVDFPPK